MNPSSLFGADLASGSPSRSIAKEPLPTLREARVDLPLREICDSGQADLKGSDVVRKDKTRSSPFNVPRSRSR
jgi:hypothetical protein